MEPRAAKKAITVTVIIAAMIVLICVGGLVYVNDLIDFSTDSEETAEEETDETAEGAVPAVPGEDPAAMAVPGIADLQGASKDLKQPESGNYLPAYETLVVRAEGKDSTPMLYEQKAPQYSREIITTLPNKTIVTAVARENGYTLVKYKDGVVGWVLTQDLDAGSADPSA